MPSFSSLHQAILLKGHCLSLILVSTYFDTADGMLPKGQESRSLMVMDMGQHVVQDCAQPLTLHQVMMPGLENRSQMFPSLPIARQLSPGQRFIYVLFFPF